MVPHRLCHPPLSVVPHWLQFYEAFWFLPSQTLSLFPSLLDLLPNSWSPNSNSLGPVVRKLICAKEGPGVQPQSLRALEIFWQPRQGGRGKWYASCMGPLAVELSQGHQAGDTGWGWREGYAPAGVVKPLCSERKCKQVRYTSCAYLHFLII